jgi:hypothetical protein
MAKKKPAKPKKPKGTPNPPPGSYDPNLDSELGRSKRGLEDLLSDIGGGTGSDPLGIQRVRAQDDLATAYGEVGQARARAGYDYDTATGNVETGYQRNLSDLLKAREQGTQDYGTNIAGVQRGYQNLGTAQAGAQRKAGVALGGAAEQARQKRAANEAIDRAPIDTAYGRFIDQSNLTQGRLGEDKQRNLAELLRSYTRGDQDLTTQGEKMGLAFQRQDTDWATQVQRGKREAGAFAGDILNAKVAQFVANNPDANLPYTALPKPPKAPGMTLTAGPGVPGTTLRKRKTKRGQTIGLYTNAVTAP